MKTIIFKNEQKAKTYEIRATTNQGCYKVNELIRVVKTDNISEFMADMYYPCKAVELN